MSSEPHTPLVSLGIGGSFNTNPIPNSSFDQNQQQSPNPNAGNNPRGGGGGGGGGHTSSGGNSRGGRQQHNSSPYVLGPPSVPAHSAGRREAYQAYRTRHWHKGAAATGTFKAGAGTTPRVIDGPYPNALSNTSSSTKTSSTSNMSTTRGKNANNNMSGRIEPSSLTLLDQTLTTRNPQITPVSPTSLDRHPTTPQLVATAATKTTTTAASNNKDDRFGLVLPEMSSSPAFPNSILPTTHRSGGKNTTGRSPAQKRRPSCQQLAAGASGTSWDAEFAAAAAAISRDRSGDSLGSIRSQAKNWVDTNELPQNKDQTRISRDRSGDSFTNKFRSGMGRGVSRGATSARSGASGGGEALNNRLNSASGGNASERSWSLVREISAGEIVGEIGTFGPLLEAISREISREEEGDEFGTTTMSKENSWEEDELLGVRRMGKIGRDRSGEQRLCMECDSSCCHHLQPEREPLLQGQTNNNDLTQQHRQQRGFPLAEQTGQKLTTHLKFQYKQTEKIQQPQTGLTSRLQLDMHLQQQSMQQQRQRDRQLLLIKSADMVEKNATTTPRRTPRRTPRLQQIPQQQQQQQGASYNNNNNNPYSYISPEFSQIAVCSPSKLTFSQLPSRRGGSSQRRRKRRRRQQLNGGGGGVDGAGETRGRAYLHHQSSSSSSSSEPDLEPEQEVERELGPQQRRSYRYGQQLQKQGQQPTSGSSSSSSSSTSSTGASSDSGSSFSADDESENEGATNQNSNEKRSNTNRNFGTVFYNKGRDDGGGRSQRKKSRRRRHRTRDRRRRRTRDRRSGRRRRHHKRRHHKIDEVECRHNFLALQSVLYKPGWLPPHKRPLPTASPAPEPTALTAPHKRPLSPPSELALSPPPPRHGTPPPHSKTPPPAAHRRPLSPPPASPPPEPVPSVASP